MLFAPHVKTKPLAEFLRRMAMSLEAGIDVRTALASEVRRSPPALRSRVEAIRLNVEDGWSIADAMNATGNYFPALVRELVVVGEQTGHLPEVLKQLTEHYDQQLALRRVFISAIAWPMMQLTMALVVVGLLIYIMGWLPATGRDRVDLLGFGLRGASGLIVYLLFLAAVATSIYIFIRAIAAGKLWTAHVQRLMLRLPQIGTALRTLAVARFAWTLQLSLEAAMDLKHALSLALASTHNIEFTEQRPNILAVIQRGDTIHEALAETNVFPKGLLDAVQVGEESGRLVETLAIVSRQQLDEARFALSLLTRWAGYAIWCLVALLIITLIFRLAGFYVGAINAAAGGK